MRTLRQTQPLPIPSETIADIHANDPEGIYTHRRYTSTVAWTDGEGRHEVPYRAPGEWSPAALDRLLADIQRGA
jgi:hypothetical protein